VLRFAPSLLVSDSDIDRALDILSAILARLSATAEGQGGAQRTIPEPVTGGANHEG
jgi:hypothetical protein